MKKTLILLTLTVATTLTLTGCGIFSKAKSDVASFESAATNAAYNHYQPTVFLSRLLLKTMWFTTMPI